MTPEEQAAAKKAEADKAAADEAAKKATEEAAKNSQDPLKAEAERIKKEKEGKSELEKAIYTYKKHDKSKEAIRERIIELGGNPDDIDDPANPDVEPADNAPVTVGMLKKIEQEKAAKTAINLANEQITDDTERELTLHHLEHSVKPSGNPEEDLRKARAIVNEVKNRQIVEEITRKQTPNRTSKNNGAPASFEGEFIPTAEEQMYMRAPWNLSVEAIKKARKDGAGTQE